MKWLPAERRKFLTKATKNVQQYTTQRGVHWTICVGPSDHVIDPKSYVRLAFGQPNKPFGKYDLTPGRWPDVWGLRPQTEGLQPIGGLRPLVWYGIYLYNLYLCSYLL